MTKTIVGLFDEYREAQRAVVELVESGIPREDIGITSRDYDTDEGSDSYRNDSSRDEGVGDKIGNFFSRLFEGAVRLREERVNVERRPVNRPVSEADLAAFREGTIELRERSEEAVVDKTARVVEEVAINKEVGERTETVRETVRKTDVDVDENVGTRARRATATGRT